MSYFETVEALERREAAEQERRRAKAAVIERRPTHHVLDESASRAARGMVNGAWMGALAWLAILVITVAVVFSFRHAWRAEQHVTVDSSGEVRR